MALSTECQTPGCLYSTQVNSNGVSVSVEFPVPLDLTEGQAEALERNLHNVLELVLARFFD